MVCQPTEPFLERKRDKNFCRFKSRCSTIFIKSKSNLSLYSLDYAEACNELAGPISASLRPGNTAPFEEMSQRWRAVGNTVSDLTGPRFEPQTSRSRDKRVTARPKNIFLYQQNYSPLIDAKKFIEINNNKLRVLNNF